MIIVEGMDNTGKTTLSEKIAKSLNLPLIHSDRPMNMEMVEYTMRKIVVGSHSVVRDRVNPVSEMIYGHVIRGESLMDGCHWMWIDAIMRSGAIIIYCRPPDAEVLKDNGREQMEGVITHNKELLRLYDWVFERIVEMWPGKVMFYDWTGRPGTKKFYGISSILNRCSSEHRQRIERILQIHSLEESWQQQYKESK